MGRDPSNSSNTSSGSDGFVVVGQIDDDAWEKATRVRVRRFVVVGQIDDYTFEDRSGF